ncbi:hypothetical protein C1H46_008974 [Malus baccata]|uniref:RNA helicase n=1 Tax=Malus baccata TaxID=106549 RepID=A0A540N2Z4_MALBA|nr:hypothetical protein C1H46_008974 [Malus baccata]
MGRFRRSERLAQHLGADAARGISYTAGDVKEYRRKRRKITAKGPSEKQDLKREITTDGTDYEVGKVEEHTALGSTSETQDLNTDVTSYTPQGSMPETQHFNTDDTSYTVEEYRQRRGITVEGCGDVPNPTRTFDDTRFPEKVIQQFSKAGFARPTPIQAQVWSMALEGRDLIGIAQPGSGKKLAYLMPAIVHINSQPKLSRGGDGPRVLILAPTLRLGEEIQQEYAKFCAASNIKVLLSWKLSSPKKSRGGILIATPRSLLVALEDGYTNVRRVTYLVLDGADWMLEKQNMGFGSQIQDIVSKIHPDCQILLLGTSWSKEVDKRANRFLYNACNVTIVSPPLKPTHPIDQTVYVVTEDQKYNKLVELLGRIVDGSRILIFMDIKEGCEKRDQFALQLYTDGQHAVSLHENKGQAEMARIVSEFQAGRIPIMIATDVAARDLDLKDVKYVINYDFPVSLDDYVYRIDRAGSAAAKGTVFTFFTTANAVFAEELIILLKEAGQKVSSELEQLGRDVPYPGTYIPAPWRWAVNQEEIGAGHFFPLYLHCSKTKDIASNVVQEINRKKGLQLHFLSVVEAYQHLSCLPVSYFYLTLEAACATTYEKKLYRAIFVRMIGDRRETILFGDVNSDGLLERIHDTRKGIKYRVYKIWQEADGDYEENGGDGDDGDDEEDEGYEGDE